VKTLVGYLQVSVRLGTPDGRLNVVAVDDKSGRSLQLKAGHLSQNVVTVTSDDTKFSDALTKAAIGIEFVKQFY
jgi:hypothetical protein